MSFRHLEPDFFLSRGRRGHELADGVENHFEPGIVFPFQFNLLSRFAWVASICRIRTKAPIISISTEKARLLRRIPESIATPCSVIARGSFRVSPQLDVPKWNFKLLDSSLVSGNIKSSGNRSRFRIFSEISMPDRPRAGLSAILETICRSRNPVQAGSKIGLCKSFPRPL
jgi:hypothetical protein